MPGILLWSRRLLLALLGIVSVFGFGGAVVSGHAVGAVLWVLAVLGVLALSAVLFGERFLASPAAVVSELAVLGAGPAAPLQILLGKIVERIQKWQISAADGVEILTPAIAKALNEAEAKAPDVLAELKAEAAK